MRLLDDFTPIIHRLPGRSIKVYAIADVHIGARECDLDGFERFIKRVASEPDSYIVLVGDLVNNGIRSASCPTDIYDETMPPRAQVDKCVELLQPVADRILGAVGGNHEARSRKAVDLDPAYEVMALLRKPELYRRDMAFLRIVLDNSMAPTRTHGVRDNYAMLLVHGSTANKKRHFAYAVEGVDAIVSAHTHDGVVEKPARLVFTTRNNVLMKPLVSLTATSWLTYGGYGAAALYMPKSTSDPQALLLEYTGSNNKEGQIRVIW